MEGTKVNVVIQSLQYRDGEKETVRQQAEGRLCREGEAYVLTYREGEASGLGRTRTTLRLEPGRAVLTREGELRARMVFQVGTPHASLYETPYGQLPMTVRTQRLEGELTQAGGRIFLIYTIESGGAHMGETRLRLTVKAKENSYDR